MPVILTSIALATVMAILSGVGLYWSQTPVYRVQPMDSVRVGDPGSNLVGSQWSGNPEADDKPNTNRSTAER
jgi:hypothetical protein